MFVIFVATEFRVGVNVNSFEFTCLFQKRSYSTTNFSLAASF